MSESLTPAENEPVTRRELSSRLYETIASHLSSDSPDIRTGMFYSDRTTTTQLRDGISVKVKAFHDYDFRDHNFPDPIQRLKASIALGDGRTYTIWDMEPVRPTIKDFESNILPKSFSGLGWAPNAPEVYVNRETTPEVEAKIFLARLGTVAIKVSNHLATYGAFIGGVEEERRQRLFNRIHKIKMTAGVEQLATEEEILALLGSLELSVSS